LIVLDEEQIVCSCGNDILAKTALRIECIGTDDASLKQDWGQEGFHVGQFIRFFSDYSFLEHNAGLDFIQVQVMHGPLVFCQMLEGSS
jgi:hypothetical protein